MLVAVALQQQIVCAVTPVAGVCGSITRHERPKLRLFDPVQEPATQQPRSGSPLPRDDEKAAGALGAIEMYEIPEFPPGRQLRVAVQIQCAINRDLSSTDAPVS